MEADLDIFGGSFKVDRIIQATSGVVNEIEFQMKQKIKAASNLFHYLVVNGSVAGGKGHVQCKFDGIRKLLAGASTEKSAESIDLTTVENIDKYMYSFALTVGQTIAQAEADKLLVEDVAKYEQKVNKYYDRYKWNQNEFDALVSFAFNIGSIDKLTANGTRSRAVIAEKMLSYNKAAGKALAGLTRRRQAERELFLNNCDVATLKAAEQLPILRKGNRGPSVLRLQQALKEHGYSLRTDGIFGDKTLEAVKAFQAENGLAVDGVVGSKTWGKL